MTATTEIETYAELLRTRAEQRPDHVALVVGDASRTYRELLDRAVWRARELRVLGLASGSHFGILLPNAVELVELLFGGALIGAVAVPINTRYRAHELRHICRDAELQAVFTTDALPAVVDFPSVLQEALPGLGSSQDRWALDLPDAPDLRAVALVNESRRPGYVDANALRAAAAEMPAPSPSDGPGPEHPAVVMYTSGTTAAAKGCVTRNGALLANARAITERFEIPETDRWWDPLPLFHMGGVLLMTSVMAAGGTFITMEHFEPDAALELIERHRATVLYPLFPTITLSLIHHGRFATIDQADIRVVVNVSPPDIQARVQDAFPEATLVSAYGMTELCGSMAYSRLDDDHARRTTSCGVPLPTWKVRIVDPETGDVVPAGVHGELAVAGPALFAGYHGDPEQTDRTIDADGYFHTGDLCSLDEAGYLSFHGRLKDQLKVGGENVSAIEVESFLATHPAVKLAQVVGIPDERYLEVPAAFVERVPGAELSAEEVTAYCVGRIARFKVPRHVRFVEEWPMSSTKIQKFRLREQLLQELQQDGPQPGSMA